MLEKYKENTKDEVWESVMAHWDNIRKYKNFRRILGRARKQAQGMTEVKASKVLEVGPEVKMMTGRVVIKT